MPDYVLMNQCSAVGTIPKGLRPSAQGWPRQRTTLGQRPETILNPNGVVPSFDPCLTQPLQGCGHSCHQPRVARSSQPWAEWSESLQDSFRALNILSFASSSPSSFSSSSSIFGFSITRTRTTMRTIPLRRRVSAPLR